MNSNYGPASGIQRRQVKRTIVPPAERQEDAYWSSNRWGPPGRAEETAPPKTVEAKKARKHYQLPTAPIAKPSATVFASLHELETLMRATLGALANFNEDERMLLTKQFRREEQKARLRGDYAPPGLVNVAQFRHAWKKFSIRGPYKPGRDATFKGKITYRPCRKPVFPPSNWDGTAALRSAKKPKAGLKLEFVYGYAGVENTASNIFFTGDGRLVYYLAAVGVVYDPASHTQRFFQGHDDDIRCLAIHPDRFLVATGQVASALDGSYDDPYVCIWDVRDPLSVISRIPFPSDGAPTRYIVAVAFSGDGQRLVVVTGDNRHTVHVLHWKSKTFIHSDVGHNGQPPQVYGIAWNNHTKSRDREGREVITPSMFVTYGVKHLKLWTQESNDRAKKETYKSFMGKFGKAQMQDVMSACFVSATTLVTGAPSGDLLTWDLSGSRSGTGQVGCCIKVIKAHGPGVPMPSIHDGTPVLQGVRSMAMRANRTELVTGGADGQIICWDITSGDVGRVIKTIQLEEPGEKGPAVFRSLDALEGGYDMVAGTHRSEIWELSKDVPEPLTQGHTADVYGLAFHPKKPHKYATACDSMCVFLWNAKRRQLLAKVNIGVEARSVAFSPNGAHLAVGTITGMVKVLRVENLTQKVAELHTLKEMVHTIMYSPDGTKLAAGSHDNFIDVYDVTRHYERLARCSGHSSYITHIDWSVDSRVIQSTCGAYELLYFEAATGKQIRQSQRDTQWQTYTCVLGFPVMGVWRDDSDGTDINALCRTYLGHCSHVMNVRFSPDNRWVVSVGGKDRAGMQWRVLKEAQDEVMGQKPPVPDVYVYEAPKRALVDHVEPPPPPPKGPGAEELAKKKEEDEERDRKRREALHTYEIVTVTSDIKGAGTDSNVFLVLYGDKNTSGEVKLENGPDNFSRGRTDTFLVDLLPLGNVHQLRIGHDAKGKNPRWHLDRVIVRDKTANTGPLVFPCGHWFATDVGDKKIVRLLKLSGVTPSESGEPKTVRYKVVVKTSDVRGAGTDANVSLQLFGEHNSKKYQSPPLKLENSANNFERAATDVFEAEAAVGEIKFIRIGHDNRWLSESDGDRQTYVTLYPVGTKDIPIPHKYQITVFTSDLRGAGTDANVDITLFGTNATVSSRLENSKNNFERNAEDVFFFEFPDLGSIPEIEIGHDNSGLMPGWHCAKVVVEDQTAQARYVYPCDRWFDKSEEDGLIRRRLKVAEVGGENTDYTVTGWSLDYVEVMDDSTGVSYFFPCNKWFDKSEGDRAIERVLPVALKDPKSAKAQYKGRPAHDYRQGNAQVIGHDNSGMGSSWHLNKVDVLLVNTGQQCSFYYNGWLAKDEPPYKTEENSKNNFEKGQRDEFIMESIDVGTIKKLQIGHDNKARQETYYFLADQWLDAKLNTLVITLEPTNAAGAKQVYKVSVRTSDKRGAGTDADISIILMGAATKSPELKLESSSNNFERNQTDDFTLNLGHVELGEIQMVEIGFATQQSAAGKLGGLFGQQWGLESVEVTHMNTKLRQFFYYDDWITGDKRRVQLVPGKAGSSNTYKVRVKTSDIRGAGTDSNVTLAMFGKLEDKPTTSGTTKLDNSANNFERGAVDTFIIKGKDLGDLTHIVITSDGSGFGAAWHLSEVEVLDTVRNRTTVFPCAKWLDPSDKASLQQTLLPMGVDGALGDLLQYEVTVYTSDIRGAGTDDNISIELHGDKASTSTLTLDTNANNFERGSKDIFKLSFVDIGELQHVLIKKDNRTLGMGGDWHLQSVEVFHPGLQKRYFMLCNDWLKGACERRLEPGKVPANGICTYRVVVTTSDIRGAGTDADVTMQLFGDKGDIGERKLDNSTNNFERNQVDTFFIQAPDVGTFQSLRIGHNNSGFGAAWHLTKVEVVNTNTGEQAVFPYHNWIDKERGLSQLLTPDRDGDGKGDALVGGPIVEYTITTYTSDLRYVCRIPVRPNNFERGRHDTFKVKASDVGDVQKVIIRHDDSGMGADWHLEQVEVTNPNTKKTYFFPCNDWLRKVGDDASGLRKELVAGSPDQKGPTNYKVTVYTSDIRGAGTDSDIFLTIYGDKGDSGERPLDNSSNNFERNQVDNFILSSGNIGAIQKLKIRSTGSGLGAAWHLNKIEVLSTATGEKLVFPFAKWIDGKNGLEHVLWPDRDGDGIPDPTTDADLMKYKVFTYTSDLRGAGTDANVYIELHGNKAFVGKTALDTNANNFERGRKDEFVISGTDVGELQHIVIGHDNSGVGSAWHLEQVEVYHPSSQKLYAFPCGEWLEVSKEKGMEGCRRTLLTGAAAAGAGMVSYRVIVHTSDIRGAGTDSDVFITIYGPKGDTGERLLDNASNNFERGKTDTFILTGSDVGELERVRVRSSGTGIGAAWHLDKIDVVSSATNTQYSFPFRDWIDEKHGLDHTINVDGGTGPTTDLVEYRVSTYTSDIRGAGTDANVTIEMHGELGSVGQSRLETGANDFERGNVDNFVVKGTNIGDVQRVIIQHDNSGIGPDWHLQQVEVFNPATQKSYFFPCSDWLRKTKELGIKGCRKELLAGVAGQSLNSYKVEVQAPDIGKIQTCQVSCSGTGIGPAWFLQHVTVTNTVTSESARFEYGNWLDDKKGWTQLLYADGTDAAQAAKKQIEYEVHVFTSDKRGAGTDGDVFLQLKGDKGAMGETKLDNAENNFESGREDVFKVLGSDIGKLTEVTVRLVERGFGAAWHLQQIEVLNKKTGERFLFRYNDWLQGDKTTVTIPEASSDAAKQQAHGKVRWKVSTQTGSMFGAGTDAKVWVQVYGPNGLLNGAEISLDNSSNNFERGALDQFFLEFPEDKDCGTPITRLVVERGSSALPGSDWHLDWLEVVDMTRGHTYRWKCAAWFSTKDGLKKEWTAEKAAAGESQPLELVESPAGAAGGSGGGDRYRIVAVTGNVLGAGTDAKVHLQFTDAVGVQWAPIFPQTKAMFERGARDEFFATAPTKMGEITACTVWIEHAGMGDNWHLDHVLLTAPSQREWRFDCRDWVPKGIGPAQGKRLLAAVARDVPLESPPLQDGQGQDLQGPGADTAAMQDQTPEPPPRPLVQYECTVVTGDKFGAGTDAQVGIELIGSRGVAKHSFDQSKTLFERGRRDRFRLTLPDVGDLTSIRSWHDGSGFGSDWFLDSIVVENAAAGCKWEAVFNEWIKGGQSNARTKLARMVAGTSGAAEQAYDQAAAAAAAKAAERRKAREAQRATVAGTQQAAAAPQTLPQPGGTDTNLGGTAETPVFVAPGSAPKRPGDDGIAKQVLPPDAFARLPQMQPGDSRYRFSNEVRNNPEPPPPVCQKRTMPYPQDSSYVLTYYFNPLTKQSSYDKPPEYAEWERKYDAWLANILK
ncbi:hypothetical protein GPECTOR_1g774 [Gonium pectorale]|uniref:PLAT domain-containing protein n=1 Tax=Gonium pectorale TaxID=33097 RepID=A0A150H4S9_GONPE|nr:hypothetical protein GPECTOR_1g774 [Gonium pectorale]|eukprot:KXZ56858.1 hypothetical protein GPECTOR_1g774 [Gonium pectorale]